MSCIYNHAQHSQPYYIDCAHRAQPILSFSFPSASLPRGQGINNVMYHGYFPLAFRRNDRKVLVNNEINSKQQIFLISIFKINKSEHFSHVLLPTPLIKKRSFTPLKKKKDKIRDNGTMTQNENSLSKQSSASVKKEINFDRMTRLHHVIIANMTWMSYGQTEVTRH